MSMPITEKLILRQINHWNRLREFLNQPGSEPRPQRRPVITVSRQAGSGGRALAESLAATLDLQVHGRSLVERIARDADLETELVSRLDEHTVSQATLWVEGVLKQKIFMRTNYHVALVKAITHLAAPGGVVFLGRGAELILGDKADLRIRVVGSVKTRLENIMRWTGLSRMESRTLLQETDRRRDDFIRSLFKVDPWNPVHYDLVLNADRLETVQMTEIALDTLLQTGKTEEMAGRA